MALYVAVELRIEGCDKRTECRASLSSRSRRKQYCARSIRACQYIGNLHYTTLAEGAQTFAGHLLGLSERFRNKCCKESKE